MERMNETDLKGLGVLPEFETRVLYLREDRPGLTRAEAILDLKESHPALFAAYRDNPSRTEQRD